MSSDRNLLLLWDICIYSFLQVGTEARDRSHAQEEDGEDGELVGAADLQLEIG